MPVKSQKLEPGMAETHHENPALPVMEVTSTDLFIPTDIPSQQNLSLSVCCLPYPQSPEHRGAQ